MIYLYTGKGAGKTTASFGLALRALGHGKKVIVIQFLKYWKNLGELKFAKKNKNLEIYQFGREGWLKKDGKEVKMGKIKLKTRKPDEEDKRLCKKALAFAIKVVKNKKPFLLILDELLLASHLGLISEEEIIKVLKKIRKKCHIVLTGRYASKKIIKEANYANEIKILKMPEEVKPEKGINY